MGPVDVGLVHCRGCGRGLPGIRGGFDIPAKLPGTYGHPTQGDIRLRHDLSIFAGVSGGAVLGCRLPPEHHSSHWVRRFQRLLFLLLAVSGGAGYECFKCAWLSDYVEV